MTVNKLGFINKVLLSSLVLVFTLLSTSTIKAETKITDQAGIVGVWQLNRAASSKTSKQSKTDLLSMPIAFAPESLILAADEGVSEITINEGFKEFIHTQTLPTDGTSITKNVQAIGQVSAKAFWKDKKLVVEVTSSRGEKMTEIFELSSNQQRLNVTLQINTGNSAKTTTVKRVYNRMAEKAEDATAEVSITEYLF